MRIKCPNCNKPQADEGKGKSCNRCGASPLPSYEYRRLSAFHPANCKCVIEQPIVLDRKTQPAKLRNLGTVETTTQKGLQTRKL